MNEITKWSNLSRLAGGRLTRLTIAAPFLAFIILHNEPLQPFLDLAESRHPNPNVQVLALARFDIFYLGLVIVGMAVGIFSVLAPDQVKGHDGYDAFIASKESTKTANGVSGSLRLTLELFVRHSTNAAAALDQSVSSPKFPRRFLEGLVSLLEALAKDVDADLKSYRKEEQQIAPGRMLDLLHTRHDDDRARWEALYSALPPYSIDVFRLEFLRSDYSHPGARLVVFWLLMVGMTVVLIPTVITTYLVILDLVEALSSGGMVYE